MLSDPSAEDNVGPGCFCCGGDEGLSGLGGGDSTLGDLSPRRSMVHARPQHLA